MTHKFSKITLSVGLLLTPVFAFAQNPTQLYNLIGIFRNVVNMLIPIVLALIFLMIVWHGFKMINTDGEEKAEYRQTLIKTIVIFFVVVSIWGIIGFMARTIGIGPTSGTPICPHGPYNPVTKSCA
jgi:succinate dehydrogenase hydrophobic anchor subunit